MARKSGKVFGIGNVGDQRQMPVGRFTRKRTRLFTYGPTVGVADPRTIPRITTSDLRVGVLNPGTKRKRIDPAVALGLAETNKSVLRRKVQKGIKQPGRSAPNYPSPLD